MSARRWLPAIAALLLLNAVLSFENTWPSPGIKLDSRLAPEFVGLWVILLLAVRVSGAPRSAATRPGAALPRPTSGCGRR